MMSVQNTKPAHHMYILVYKQFICIFINIYIFIYKYIYKYICIYIYIKHHTHTHIKCSKNFLTILENILPTYWFKAQLKCKEMYTFH